LLSLHLLYLLFLKITHIKIHWILHILPFAPFLWLFPNLVTFQTLSFLNPVHLFLFPTLLFLSCYLKVAYPFASLHISCPQVLIKARLEIGFSLMLLAWLHYSGQLDLNNLSKSVLSTYLTRIHVLTTLNNTLKASHFSFEDLNFQFYVHRSGFFNHQFRGYFLK